MKVTIKDIAKKAGVSVSTVSLVLNDRPCRVAQQTRDTIKDIAKQYNYKVNQTARSLVTRKSNILKFHHPGYRKPVLLRIMQTDGGIPPGAGIRTHDRKFQ